jgi:hypothetical protein
LIDYTKLKKIIVKNVQAPEAPRTEVLEPTFTTVLPVMVPSMMTILALSPDTAEVKAERVDTLVVDPPTPPVVL